MTVRRSLNVNDRRSMAERNDLLVSGDDDASRTSHVTRVCAPHAVTADRKLEQIRFFTVVEVADRLSVSTRTVRRWIGAGELVVYRVGGVVRIAEYDLRAFLALRRDG